MYAHSLPGKSPSDWEQLQDHLAQVAVLSAGFAAEFSAAEWGRIAGRWHDLGKFSREFQEYLLNSACHRVTSQPGKVDHSTAGAQHAVGRFPRAMGKLLAYCIAGHHAGLPNNADGGPSSLTERLTKRIPDWSVAPRDLLNESRPEKPAFDWEKSDPNDAAFQWSVFCRMLFSCLVDADFLATEMFMRPDRATQRGNSLPKPAELLPLLDAHLAHFATRANLSSVNQTRGEVLASCRRAAELPPGFFSLTVPTGGGKTLSSLAFALSHAARHGQRRVIYAIPFTSIVEQNAEVFRRALAAAGNDVVLEHHSGFELPEAEDDTIPVARLAMENWDAPLVVTTNVQLFESLFANKTSRCRKLHRIVKSVIILDECQSLPVNLLRPTLMMLEELCRNYGCTVVFCSATQPAIQHREGFQIGLCNVREIIDDPPRLFETLRRVEVERIGKLDIANLAGRLSEHDRALCVVNTKDHASRIFRAMRESGGPTDGEFHLSASMCAAHRTVVLDRVRERVKSGDPCVVISTQVIEAGVDIDFPVVYRAMTGLDSIAQAAGRCNREGLLPRGRVYIFDTDVDPRGDLRIRRQLGTEVAGLHHDLLGLDAIDHYFRLVYWSRKDEWDAKEILKQFSLSGNDLHFQFREAAKRYQLIEDAQTPIIVPYGEYGKKLMAELGTSPVPPGRGFDRRVQRYIVNVHEQQLQKLVQAGAVAQYHERYWVLEDADRYDEDVGLQTELRVSDPGRFVV